MDNNKKFIFSRNFIILLIILSIVFFIISFISKSSEKNGDVPIDTESTELNIEYSQEELTGEWKEYNAKIVFNDDKTSIEGTGVSNNGAEIKITKAGTYYITGTISDANILIEAVENDDVQLVLDNCSITSSTTAPINGVECNNLTITLADNSINTLTDGTSYTVLTDTESSEPDGTLFTKTDLVINGNGKLIVNANYLDGIVSKDELKIINSNIEVNSADDGIRGKDYVAINNATIVVNSGGDGIKSTNTDDTKLGYVSIEGGTISIDSEADGIQAETVLNVSQNANITINTSGEVSSSLNSGYGYSKHGYVGGYSSQSSTTEDSSSSKALKAGSEITIESGNINITSTDDSIHSNGIIVIDGGIINLSSEDDGIHADTNIVINDGNIDVSKSYEGIESAYIEINGGAISVIASDDGINISGGNDSSSMGERPGKNSFSNIGTSNQKLVINNGDINVNASGDGLDANGSIYINGGSVLVIGPTNSGNGALDYDTACEFNGGDIIIYGSSGMWQDATSGSTQYTVTFKTSGSSGDKLVLKDSSGNEVTSITTEKSYGAITISNSKIEKGETYTLYKNNSSVGSITVSSIINSSSGSGYMNGGGMNGKHKGGF